MEIDSFFLVSEWVLLLGLVNISRSAASNGNEIDDRFELTDSTSAINSIFLTAFGKLLMTVEFHVKSTPFSFARSITLVIFFGTHR